MKTKIIIWAFLFKNNPSNHQVDLPPRVTKHRKVPTCARNSARGTWDGAKPHSRGTKDIHQIQAVSVCDSSSSSQAPNRAGCRQVGHSHRGRGNSRASNWNVWDKDECQTEPWGLPKGSKAGQGQNSWDSPDVLTSAQCLTHQMSHARWLLFCEGQTKHEAGPCSGCARLQLWELHPLAHTNKAFWMPDSLPPDSLSKECHRSAGPRLCSNLPGGGPRRVKNYWVMNTGQFIKFNLLFCLEGQRYYFKNWNCA